MALGMFKRSKAELRDGNLRPPKEPDGGSVTEADLLQYGDELIDYLEKRYPLQRDENGTEVGSRF